MFYIWKCYAVYMKQYCEEMQLVDFLELKCVLNNYFLVYEPTLRYTVQFQWDNKQCWHLANAFE